MPAERGGNHPDEGDGPMYAYSAAAAAEILNLHFDPSQPKPVLFGRIQATILGAMRAAAAELPRVSREPSDN